MIKFGPSGNSLRFYQEGYKSTVDAPLWLANQGLNIYEYSFGRGINISDAKANEIAQKAVENGVEITYTIVEDVILGYETEINYTEIDANNIISATIINTHVPETVELNVNKIWLDRDDIMGLRPDNIEVDLYADGEFVKTVVITKENNWHYIFSNLDKYKDGVLIDYKFMEKAVYGYTTTYDKSYIINTLDNYIYPEDPEILPPQTGVKNNRSLLNYIVLAIIGLFIFKQKNA